jgi:hypothetical protein
MIEGLADVSPFRAHVENDQRDGLIALRIDRVVSPWSLTQLEQTLISSQSFEAGALAAVPAQRPATNGGRPSLLGRATGIAADGKRPLGIEYAIVDLGAEKLVARYVGAPEQLSFNASVLRVSLASLEGSRLYTGVDRVDAVEWAPTRIALGDKALPAPAGWIAEPSGPSPCGGLPPPAAAATLFPPADSTITMRAAVWTAAAVSADAAASRCSPKRGAAGAASYVSRAEFLGVAYAIEGVFVPIASGQIAQLEIVAPEQKSALARTLLGAWLAKIVP